MSNSDDLEKLQAKINDLESSLGYLQRDFESQNEMIILDAARIQKLEQSVISLEVKLNTTIASNQSPRTIEDDVPPHY